MGTKSLTALPVLLALSAPLAAAQWYIQPGQVGRTLIALATVGALTLIYRAVPVRATDDATRQRACRDIQTGLFFATLIVDGALGAKLAAAFGLLHDVEFSQRATMVLLGAFIATTGNAIPKTLTPLASLRCDPARVPAFHRLAGWTWTLAGVGLMVAWLTLPASVAGPAAVILVTASAAIIATGILVLRRSRRPRTAEV